MKKGTTNCVSECFSFASHHFALIYFFNATAPLLPLLLPLPLSPLRIVSTLVNQTPPDRQPASHVRWVRWRGAPALRGVLPLLLGRVRRQEPTRGQSVAVRPALSVGQDCRQETDAHGFNAMKGSHSFHGFSLIRFGYCFVSCVLVFVHLRGVYLVLVYCITHLRSAFPSPHPIGTTDLS